MKLKEKIIFKCKSGSMLYGTNSETSDVDYKGVFLPNIDDLILNKAPKNYTFSTSSDKTKNTKDDVDESYYSLHYFLELLAKGETNALDLFFAYTNKNAIVFIEPIWKELIENADKLITKNINSYLGYCISQSIKYSIKGEKFTNFTNFHKLISKYIGKHLENGIPYTLDDILKNEYGLLIEGESQVYAKGDNVIGKRIPILSDNNGKKLNFGDHVYYLIMNNKEKYLMISDLKFNLNDIASSTLNKIKNTLKSYGERSKNAADDNGADYKALSHAVRVLNQSEELLTTGKITFPLKNAEFIKSIKYKTTDLSYAQIVEYLNEKIEYINKEILPKSKLRSDADFDFIKEFILKQYKGV